MQSLYEKPNYVYVASSWRNAMHTGICAMLRAAGIDHYDFKKDGFSWSDVGLPDTGASGTCNKDTYLKALQHPNAVAGFDRDYTALCKATCTILVLPAGNSAHLELGYAIGECQRTAILMPQGEDIRPDLMYKLADLITDDVMQLLTWLGVSD